MLQGSQNRLDDLPPDSGPRVSVVIPCYNQGSFLSAAIDSALKQTYAPCEIVVVDDGSTDETAEVVARYPVVRCIRQSNRGVAAARNTGLRVSLGDYIVFVDADDRLLPDALQAGVSRLQADRDCAFVVGQCRRIDADGQALPPDLLPRPDRDLYAELLRHCFIWCPATVMYVRGPLLANGGFTQLKYTGTEDYELYLRLARNYPYQTHDRVVAEYRVHTASMSNNAARMLRSTLATLNAQRNYIANYPKYKDDWHFGIRAARRYYGPKMLESVVFLARNGGGLKCLIRELLIVIRLLRLAFVPVVAKRVLFSLERLRTL